MSSIRDSQVQRLHQSVTQRETQYLQVIHNHLPPRLTTTLENNFFTSTALYTTLLILAFLLSIFDKTGATHVAEESKNLVTEVKQNFLEEKEHLNAHFAKILEDARRTASRDLDTARSEAQKAVETVQSQLGAAKEAASRQVSSHASQLASLKAELAAKEARLEKETREALDAGKVQVSDLHYQLVEKEKHIKALQSSETHLTAELARERELHESSREALHDAVEKLIHAKQELAHVRKPVA